MCIRGSFEGQGKEMSIRGRGRNSRGMYLELETKKILLDVARPRQQRGSLQKKRKDGRQVQKFHGSRRGASESHLVHLAESQQQDARQTGQKRHVEFKAGSKKD
jgi:hypothetical protein